MEARSSTDLFLPSESLIIIINLMRVANYPQQIADERRKRPRKKYCDRLSAVGGGWEGGATHTHTHTRLQNDALKIWLS